MTSGPQPTVSQENTRTLDNAANGQEAGDEGSVDAVQSLKECPPVPITPSKRPSALPTGPAGGEDDFHEIDLSTSPVSPSGQRTVQQRQTSNITVPSTSPTTTRTGVSEWSHQQLAVQDDDDEPQEKELEWQTMPAYAPFDIYDDDGKLIAKEAPDETDTVPKEGYGALGSAAKGYTRVQDDEDAKSTTSMDENTQYLFKETTNRLYDEDEEARDALSQRQMTKQLLSDNQRIAYVGIVKLAISELCKVVAATERTRGSRKQVDLAAEAIKLWGQKMMVRLYGHMELDSAEQVMIEQLAEHGLETKDLTPSLMTSSTVKNPNMQNGSVEDLDGTASTSRTSMAESISTEKESLDKDNETLDHDPETSRLPPPAYQQKQEEDDDGIVPKLQAASELSRKESLDIDLRWTILCDLFLLLISDSTYDARSRVLLEKVANSLDITWIDVCRFEKRVTEALEMEEEEAQKRDELDETHNMEKRRKRARNRRIALMGLATVGGGLVIGLSAGLLAPVIGAGLAAGFTTIGVTGTSTFLAGAGGAAVIGTVGTVTGGTVGVRAANRRTGAVKTFEYRPLHNNKRVNLIVTVAGWMTGKVDDVRLPYSTIDPIMGDVYSILWEPEMLRSMGDTINILATEALTQGLQQVLGSTILIALMAALQLPIVLSKLSYLIDNPWSVSVARAEAAGLILADSLVERNLGARPITLVGFSLGSRVIFSALKELASKGALGLVQNVYIFGTPVVVKKDEYLRARTVVSGRFVNGYATNDWILGYLFRATGGGIMRVAGLSKVEVPGIENFDVTKFVAGHMAYRKSMPRLLRELDWAVTSDEFAEIEDPDPDNHEKRQRELIDEIEEARLKLQEKPEKRRFGIFGRSKKRAEKKAWETYDDSIRQEASEQPGDPNGPLFDIEAIRREAIELAAEGIEIKQLESTLPALKIDADVLTPPLNSARMASKPATPTISSLIKPSRPSSPVKNGLGLSHADDHPAAPFTNGKGKATEVPNDYSYFDDRGYQSPTDQDISMSFDTSYERAPSPPPKPVAGPSRSVSPANGWHNFGSSPNLAVGPTSPITLPPYKRWNSRPSSPNIQAPAPQSNGLAHGSANTNDNAASKTNVNGLANPWADADDDIGEAQELSMTFE